MSFLREIIPLAKNTFLSERDVLSICAAQIEAEIQQGERKNYNEVLDLSSGDLHRGGTKPITFVRQVLAACFYPALLEDDSLPLDVKQRAECLLRQCDGGSVGSYTDSCGIAKIKQCVSKFITRRDGGVPSSPDNIFITSGSQMALMFMLKLLVQSGSCRTGVLIPVPTYATVIQALEDQGAAIIPYHLCEEQGWTLQVEELRRSLHAGRRTCNPVALYICNPGNPTGHIQSRKSIEEVIRFAAEERLFLLADEVYQSCVYGEDTEFESYKKVLSEMGSTISSTVELASFNSASKGFMGECGLRGGYMELVNLDPAVKEYTRTFFSTRSSPPVGGQIALDLMTDPPKPGDPSFPTFSEEIQSIKNMISKNACRIQEVFGEIPGISCQPLKAGFFVFPCLHLPPRAIKLAKKKQMEPDMLYCLHLLEETGLHVRPGCEYGQRKDSHHFRLFVATHEDTMEDVLQRLKTFHKRFMKEFS
ncbi:alanine aminotransferase 2 [Rhinichthys klamathensis goyatoka]|uniref:alanine aminotransferase 2 n=1 Tax=Rhinichthys klamathensis goyatoka TaxID=3034132 RepID=UPI0024B4B373|nr:alanine aminotransferase 2 [Rhinichthys klamathensis goyatoka]